MEKINTKEILKTARVTNLSKLSKLNKLSTIHIIQIGNDEASNKYVNNKIKRAYEFDGKINTVLHKYSDCTEENADIINKMIYDLTLGQYNNSNNKIMIQMPTSDKIVANDIPAINDIDGLYDESEKILYSDLAKTYIKNNKFFNIPATARGCLYLSKVLHSRYLSKINEETGERTGIDSAIVLIIGRSKLVGKPLRRLLELNNATVLQAHSYTPKDKLIEMINIADIIIPAVGKHGIIDSSMIKKNSTKVIIDVGINFDDNGKMCGDFKPLDEDKDKQIFYTPVPGGVGLFTTEFLMYNALEIPID